MTGQAKTFTETDGFTAAALSEMQMMLQMEEVTLSQALLIISGMPMMLSRNPSGNIPDCRITTEKIFTREIYYPACFSFPCLLRALSSSAMARLAWKPSGVILLILHLLQASAM